TTGRRRSSRSATRSRCCASRCGRRRSGWSARRSRRCGGRSSGGSWAEPPPPGRAGGYVRSVKGLRAGLAVLTVAVLGALTSACSAGGPGGVSSDGACAGPTLIVEPATAAPGDTVTVTGEGMIDGCDDHQGVDDDGTVRSFETQAPMRRVEIEL